MHLQIICVVAVPMFASSARLNALLRRKTEATMNIQISRRDALLGSGALVVSFSLAGALDQVTAQATTKPVVLTEVDSFLAIDKSGKVAVYSGKVDLGTGVYTALQQI